ncbi:MAG: prolyl oligopeptidase family serine peptidase [Alphaproteobacteria bacterium]|nr:prolyl oligopeptidase family serine peptidase [Alphaproteobacteria bacterium]
METGSARDLERGVVGTRGRAVAWRLPRRALGMCLLALPCLARAEVPPSGIVDPDAPEVVAWTDRETELARAWIGDTSDVEQALVAWEDAEPTADLLAVAGGVSAWQGCGSRAQTAWWRLEEGQEEAFVVPVEEARACAASFSRDGRHLAVGWRGPGQDADCVLWRYTRGGAPEGERLPVRAREVAAAWSPDATRLLVGLTDDEGAGRLGVLGEDGAWLGPLVPLPDAPLLAWEEEAVVTVWVRSGEGLQPHLGRYDQLVPVPAKTGWLEVPGVGRAKVEHTSRSAEGRSVSTMSWKWADAGTASPHAKPAAGAASAMASAFSTTHNAYVWSDAGLGSSRPAGGVDVPSGRGDLMLMLPGGPAHALMFVLGEQTAGARLLSGAACASRTCLERVYGPHAVRPARALTVPRRDGETLDVWVLESDATVRGDAPVRLHVYGGFGNETWPYASAADELWAAAGGLVAWARLRGDAPAEGGRHHRGPHRAVVFEDAVDVARGLVDAGLTRPGRIVLLGMSNGGLTAVGAMARAPDLFGAVVADAGLYDLVEGPRLGRWWPGEYGRPAWRPRVLRALSPVHDAPSAHPPILLRTGRADPIVSPIHTYREAAALAPTQGLTLLRVWPWEGHLSTPPEDAREVEAEALVFATRALGLPAEWLVGGDADGSSGPAGRSGSGG